MHSHCPRASSICLVRAVCPLRAVTGGLAGKDGLGQNIDCVPLYLVSGLFWSSSSHMQTSSLLSKPSYARVSAQANSLVCYVICASNLFQSTTPIFRDNAFPDTQREVSVLLIWPYASCQQLQRYRTAPGENAATPPYRMFIGSLIKPATTFLLELQQCCIGNGTGASLFAVNGLP